MTDIGANDNRSGNRSHKETNDQNEISRIAEASRNESKGKHSQSWINMRNYTCLPILVDKGDNPIDLKVMFAKSHPL